MDQPVASKTRTAHLPACCQPAMHEASSSTPTVPHSARLSKRIARPCAHVCIRACPVESSQLVPARQTILPRTTPQVRTAAITWADPDECAYACGLKPE